MLVARISLLNLAHDKKLAVLGICNLIQLPTMPGEVASSLQHIFKALIQILATKEDPKTARIVDVGPSDERINLMEFITNDGETTVGSMSGMSS